MRRVLIVPLVFSYISLAVPEGRLLFENHCLRCHTEGSKKPVSYLKRKYRNNTRGVLELARRCPWSRGLSEMEIGVIAEWLSGGK